MGKRGKQVTQEERERRKIVGRAIRQARQAAEMSGLDVLMAIRDKVPMLRDLSGKSYYNWENGEQPVDIEIIRGLEEVFHILDGRLQDAFYNRTRVQALNQAARTSQVAVEIAKRQLVTVEAITRGGSRAWSAQGGGTVSKSIYPNLALAEAFIVLEEPLPPCLPGHTLIFMPGSPEQIDPDYPVYYLYRSVDDPDVLAIRYEDPNRPGMLLGIGVAPLPSNEWRREGWLHAYGDLQEGQLPEIVTKRRGVGPKTPAS